MFRYRARRWLTSELQNNEGCAITMVIGILVVSLVCIVAIFSSSKFPENLMLISFMLVFAVFGSWSKFFAALRQVDLELTQEHIVFHLTQYWKLSICLRDLYPVRIQERIIWEANAFGFANHNQFDLTFFRNLADSLQQII